MAHERGIRYGPDAWLLTGNILKMLYLGYVQEAGFLSPYVKIFSKLIRVMVEPKEIEHWLDIEAYAGLVREHLQRRDL